MNGHGGVDRIGLIIGIIDELGIQDGDGSSLVSADEPNYSMYPEKGRLIGSIQKHLREVPIEKMAVGQPLSMAWITLAFPGSLQSTWGPWSLTDRLPISLDEALSSSSFIN